CAANIPMTARPRARSTPLIRLEPFRRFQFLRRRTAIVSVLAQEPDQEGLLRVQAVLGLVPYDALRTVDDLRVDLITTVGRQAVDEDRFWVGEAHRLGGDLVPAEVADASELLLFLAHRDPGVGDDDVGAGRCRC